MGNIFGNIFGEGDGDDLPPSLKLAFSSMAASADRHNMEHTEKITRIQNFLEGLNNEDLLTMRLLLTDFAETGRKLAIFYEGVLIEKMRARDICPNCGVNHDAEALEEERAKVQEREPQFVGEVLVKDDNEPPPSLQDLMLKYRVTYTSGAIDDARVTCNDCGYTYPNLNDRMLRDPDTCPGCQIKASQG